MTTLTRAEDVRAGDFIDLAPLLEKYAPENEGARIIAEFELGYVESVRHDDDAPWLTYIYTDIANLAVSRDELVTLGEEFYRVTR